MNVHPNAAMFPMMSEPELRSLADDIKANGLKEAITLADWDDVKDGLVDGRNRLKACEMAGVEPQFAHLNGEDVRAFIISKNVERRSLTAGQKAMAVAMIYPEPKRGGVRTKGSSSNLEVAHGRLSEARAILRWSSSKAHEVLSGVLAFDRALTEMKAQEQSAKGRDAKLGELRDNAPDIADLVMQGKVDFEQAVSQMQSRLQDRRRVISAGRQAVEGLSGEMIGKLISIKAAREAQESLPPLLANDADAARPVEFTAKQVSDIRSVLDLLEPLLNGEQR
jgi:hypothetical protein